MYDPAATSNASQFEFIELQNIGAKTLDLTGVRFTNGIDYVFPAGITLPAGAFIIRIRVTDAGQTVLVTNFATWFRI